MANEGVSYMDQQRNKRRSVADVVAEGQNNVIGQRPGSGGGDSGAPLDNSFTGTQVIDGNNDSELGGSNNRLSRNPHAENDMAAAMGNDKFAFNQISYPTDITTNKENGHYMLFYVNVQNKSKYHYKDYKGVDVGGITTIFNKGGEGSLDAASRATPDSYTEGVSDAAFKLNLLKSGTPGNRLESNFTELAKSQQVARTGMRTWAPTTTRISDSIALYLPGSISNNLTAEYSSSAMGVIGFAAAAGLKFTDQFGNDDFEGAAKTLQGAIGSVGEDILQRALAGIADLSTGVEGTYQFANQIFGRATNPYMEVLFKETPLRTFTYTFSFQPKDQQERDDVQDIIKTFRFHMAPELQEQNMRFMGIPSTFDIHYMYQSDATSNKPMDWRQAEENDFVNKIATCVLTKCDVTYNDAAKSFQDGSPTSITMALSFTETEMITKEKINEGF